MFVASRVATRALKARLPTGISTRSFSDNAITVELGKEAFAIHGGNVLIF